MIRSKICGVSDLATLKYIINHNYPPQFLGFICYYIKSKRYVNFDNLVKLITVVSVLIPIAVAILLFMPSKIDLFGDWTYKLPHFNAIINSLTSLFLILSFYMIKYKKNIKAHQNLNTASFILGSIFLVSYIIYHSSVESTPYQGDQRVIYFSFLISHILLSIVVVPFVLFAFYYGAIRIV